MFKKIKKNTNKLQVNDEEVQPQVASAVQQQQLQEEQEDFKFQKIVKSAQNSFNRVSTAQPDQQQLPEQKQLLSFAEEQTSSVPVIAPSRAVVGARGATNSSSEKRGSIHANLKVLHQHQQFSKQQESVQRSQNATDYLQQLRDEHRKASQQSKQQLSTEMEMEIGDEDDQKYSLAEQGAFSNMQYEGMEEEEGDSVQEQEEERRLHAKAEQSRRQREQQRKGEQYISVNSVDEQVTTNLDNRKFAMVGAVEEEEEIGRVAARTSMHPISSKRSRIQAQFESMQAEEIEISSDEEFANFQNDLITKGLRDAEQLQLSGAAQHSNTRKNHSKQAAPKLFFIERASPKQCLKEVAEAEITARKRAELDTQKLLAKEQDLARRQLAVAQTQASLQQEKVEYAESEELLDYWQNFVDMLSEKGALAGNAWVQLQQLESRFARQRKEDRLKWLRIITSLRGTLATEEFNIEFSMRRNKLLHLEGETNIADFLRALEESTDEQDQSNYDARELVVEREDAKLYKDEFVSQVSEFQFEVHEIFADVSENYKNIDTIIRYAKAVAALQTDASQTELSADAVRPLCQVDLIQNFDPLALKEDTLETLDLIKQIPSISQLQSTDVEVCYVLIDTLLRDRLSSAIQFVWNTFSHIQSRALARTLDAYVRAAYKERTATARAPQQALENVKALLQHVLQAFDDSLQYITAVHTDEQQQPHGITTYERLQLRRSYQLFTNILLFEKLLPVSNIIALAIDKVLRQTALPSSYSLVRSENGGNTQQRLSYLLKFFAAIPDSLSGNAKMSAALREIASEVNVFCVESQLPLPLQLQKYI